MRQRNLVVLLLSACLYASVTAVTVEEETFMLRSLSSAEVVTYGPCDKPKCPAIQKPTGPPPPGYVCNCADPSEVEDCGCNLKTGCCKEREKADKAKKACDCKNSHIHTKAVTRVFDPSKAPKPRPPKNENRKFNHPTSAPNPLPPVDSDQCRPNVAAIGPGNCRRGGHSATCKDADSGCKNSDNASMGFVAASLTNDVDPSDKPEGCEHEVDAKDAIATAVGPQGKSYATVNLKNKCTGKKRWLHKANVFVDAPQVVTQSGQVLGQLGSSSLSGSLSGSSALGSLSGSLGSLSGSLASGSSAVPPNLSGSGSGSATVNVSPTDLQSMINNAVQNALANRQSSQSNLRPVPQSSVSSLLSSASPLAQSLVSSSNSK